MTHAYQTQCIRCNHTDHIITSVPLRRNQATGPCSGDHCTGTMHINARRPTRPCAVVLA